MQPHAVAGAPMVLLYAAVHILATLIARLPRRRPRAPTPE